MPNLIPESSYVVILKHFDNLISIIHYAATYELARAFIDFHQFKYCYCHAQYSIAIASYQPSKFDDGPDLVLHFVAHEW